MQVTSIAECSKGHSAILLTFIKLPFVIKIFALTIFEWPFYTGFTVVCIYARTIGISLVFPECSMRIAVFHSKQMVLALIFYFCSSLIYNGQPVNH